MQETHKYNGEKEEINIERFEGESVKRLNELMDARKELI